MRKGILLIFSLALLLGGCSAMLNRPYQVITPHEYHATPAEGDSGVPDAGTYQALVNNIFSFVEDGVTHGVIRLSSYNSKSGDIAGDLSAACNEVANEDPLGAYVVDFIKSSYTRVVKYYEASIDITYRRTPEQVRNLVNVTGSSAIREELRDVLRTFRGESVLRVGYFAEDEDYIASLIQQAYYNTPEAALGMPQYTIALYPDQAERGPRIVEIKLSYAQESEVLRRSSEALLQKAAELLTPAYIFQGEGAAQAILEVIRDHVSETEESENTAYAALVEGRAGSEGAALAVQLLAQQSDIECHVVKGSLNGLSRFWNMVRQAGGDWRHMDALNSGVEFLTDSSMEELGYVWDREEYPACEAPVTPEEDSRTAELPQG